LKQAKADLKEQLGGEEYKCPIPDGVNPAPVK